MSSTRFPARPSTPSIVGASLSRLGPTRLALVASLVAFQGLVRLAERTLPAVVLELGFGPIVVGLLGSVAVAASCVVRIVGGDADAGADVDADADGRPSSTGVVAPTATALAAVALVVWTGAPSLDALLETSLSAVGWLLLGAALLGPWYACGPGRFLTLGTGGMAAVPVVGSGAETEEGDDRLLVSGALGLGGGALLATAAFAGADTLRAGFALVGSAGGAVGLVAAITLALVAFDRQFVPGNRVTVVAPSRTLATGPGSDCEFRDALESLPRAVRRTIVGDALVRLTVVSTTLYVVLVVVDVHASAVALSAGNRSLPPIAAFSLFVLAEAVGGLVGALAAPALVDVVEDASIDRRWPLVGGLTIVSLVPLTIVAFASPPLLALAFAFFGCRTAVEPLRPTGRSGTGAVEDGEVPDAIETAAHLAFVPAPLIGGVLYAVSPVVAFALASTVGLVGVRELLGAIRGDSRG